MIARRESTRQLQALGRQRMSTATHCSDRLRAYDGNRAKCLDAVRVLHYLFG